VKYVGDALEVLREIELAQIAFDELVILAAAKVLQVALLQWPWIEIFKGINGAPARALIEQPLAQVRSDESCAARDQCVHANSVSTRSGMRTGRPSRSIVACTVWPVASSAPSARRIAS